MRSVKTINKIIVFILCTINIGCIKEKNLYDDELAEKEVISDPEFFYPFINEPIDHTAEITIQVKEGVQVPIQPTAVIPPLKYNKSWLFMLTQDDCKHAADSETLTLPFSGVYFSEFDKMFFRIESIFSLSNHTFK